MNINAMTVSVGYAEQLRRGISLWFESVQSLTVVTDTRDDDTARVAESFGCGLHRTDVFYANGAKFNKGGAMEEARRETMPWADWALFFDADIVPPVCWHVALEDIEPGYLYGARRCDESGVDIPDKDVVGYFQLFHTEDPAVAREPVLESFNNASGYDSVLWERWGKPRCRWLDLTVKHYGTPGANWCGIGNKQALAQLHAERRRLRGWRHERIAP